MKKWKVRYKENHTDLIKEKICDSFDEAVYWFHILLSNHNGPVTIIHPND